MAKWMPTRKWWSATVVAAGTVAVALWAGNGIDTDDEKILVVGLVVQRISSYFIPNKEEV